MPEDNAILQRLHRIHLNDDCPGQMKQQVCCIGWQLAFAAYEAA